MLDELLDGPTRRPRSWSESARAASPASASGSPPRTAWPSAGARELAGMSSLALLAAGVRRIGEVAAAVDRRPWRAVRPAIRRATLEALANLRNLAAGRSGGGDRRAHWSSAPAPRQLVEARGWGEAREAWPSAAECLRLPEALRILAAQAGLRARARRASQGGRMMATRALDRHARIDAGDVRRPRRGDGGHERGVRRPLRRGLDPLAMRRDPADGRRVADAARDGERRASSASRCFARVADEAELLLLAVAPDHRRRGVGQLLLDHFLDSARDRRRDAGFISKCATAIRRLACTGAPASRRSAGAATIISGRDGQRFDALTLALEV